MLTNTLLVSSAVGAPTVVFPPGQEELLAAMFGGNPSASASCTFASGRVDGGTLTTEYACETGTVVLEIGHAGRTRGRAIRTEQFAIAVRQGSPPPEFLAALESRVRALETAFTWKSLAPERPFLEQLLGGPSPARGRASMLDAILFNAVILLPTATVLVGLALVGRAVLRRRRPTRQR